MAASEEHGIDGEKNERHKRYIVADVMGNLLGVVVHAANIHDTKSGIEPAKCAIERYPSIKRYCGDTGYRGSFVFDGEELLYR